MFKATMKDHNQPESFVNLKQKTPTLQCPTRAVS